MSDRAVIIALFEELTGAQFKRARGFLKDYGVPGGTVEQIKDPDDMADLMRRYFEGSKRKEIIRDILKNTKCEDVIEKFNDYLSDSPQRSADGGGGLAAAQNVTSSASNSGEKDRMAEHEIKPLALLYVFLSDWCREDDLEKLKTFVDDDIPPRQLEKMKSGTDIFKSLEDKGIISSTNVNYLKKLFKRMQKEKLVTKIEDYEAGRFP
ncbi:uncharacterized protein [Ptychodera flava]|uniref:uncharacterized protein n=1 Tax=Ptychodera flava TaxID=63121 RepID=UPI00396A89EA